MPVFPARRTMTALLVIALAAGATAQGTTWSIRTLTAPNLGRGAAWDIDDEGTVAGELLDAAGIAHPVVWRHGIGCPLPHLPGGNEGMARTVVAGGFVGGASANASTPTSATIWLPNGAASWTALDLGVAPGDVFSVVLGLDGTGMAVGYSDDGFRPQPVFWGGTDAQPAPTVLPLPSWALAGSATAVTATGCILGYVADQSTSRPVSWSVAPTGIVMTPLPTLGSWGAASDANAAGLVVGGAISPVTGHIHIVSWTNGAIADHGQLPGTDCVAEAVNDHGDMVGWARTFAMPPYAAVYKPAGQPIVDLNTLLPPQSGWQLARAEGINAAGAIVGTGTRNGFSEPFLMTPVHVALSAPALGRAGANDKFAVRGVTPNAAVHLFVALGGGETVVPGCVQGLDLAAPILVASAMADAAGDASIGLYVPAFAANLPLLFQAYDPAGCATSNVVPVTFQ